MKTIGFSYKNSAESTYEYAKNQHFPTQLTSKELENQQKIYFVWVDKMTDSQTKELNKFAENLRGFLWPSEFHTLYNDSQDNLVCLYS